MSAPPSPGFSAASDTDLMALIAARDRAAFEEMFHRYARRVKAYALRAGLAPGDADEIAQDVMVTVWNRAGTFDPMRAAPSTWIFTIARNRRIDHLRRTLRPGPDSLDPMFEREAETDGLGQMAAAERDARLRASLADLGPEQREVLIAAFFEGRSHAEIATRLGLPLGTVKSRIRLAFRRLRGILGDDLAEELGDD